MESRTTPSLSFSMPGRMSATASGRRGGGQIWLTVRCTGCFFFFHREGSCRVFPKPGILEGRRDQTLAASLQSSALSEDPGPTRARSGLHHTEPGMHPAARQAQKRSAPTCGAPVKRLNPASSSE